jgi:hypothetical protein
VRTDHKTGEILVWPYIEQTLTPTPANPYSVVRAAKHFDEAKIGLHPALRGILDLTDPETDLPSDLTGATANVGEEAATQRVEGNPDRERLIRRFVELAPKVGRLNS